MEAGAFLGLKHLEAAGKVFCLLPGSLACLPCSSVVSRTVRLVFGRQRWAPAKTKIGRHPLYCFSPHSILFQNVFDGYYYLHSSCLCVPSPRHSEFLFGGGGGARGGGLREENSGRDALQSFATALLVAAPQTALSRLPPLLPPAPPGSAAATSSSPLFGRTAPRTRSGTLLSCAASF